MYFDSLLKSRWWKLKKKNKRREKLYKSWDFIQENMYTLDSFSDIFLQESLRPTFKTVYAHRKNHSGKSLIFWHKKVYEKLWRTYLLTIQSKSLLNCTFLTFIQQMNGLHGNNLSYTTHHHNNISTILHDTLLSICIHVSLLRQTINQII